MQLQLLLLKYNNTVRTLGKQFTKRWFSYEQHNRLGK